MDKRIVNPFQSSSGQKAGCNSRLPRGFAFSPGAEQVSILIRPEGRMQQPVRKGSPMTCWRTFQSSSGQKAGCNACI